jgi:hypothetical protein
LQSLSQNSSYSLFFLGASDKDQEGIWRWITGPESNSQLTYSYWRLGEPNNGLGSFEEDCIVFHNGKANVAGWYDVLCGSAPYIIEYTTYGNELLFTNTQTHDTLSISSRQKYYQIQH